MYVQGVGSHVQQLLEVVEQKRRAIHSLAEESGEGAQSAASLTRQRASLLSTLKLCMVRCSSFARCTITRIPHSWRLHLILFALFPCLQAMQQVAHAKGALDNTIAAAPHAGLDYMGALEILAGLKESAAHVPVGVSAIGSLPEYMDRMRASIQSSMVSDMLERCKFDSAKYLDTLLSGDAAVGSASLENGNGVDSLVLALLPPITGLCRIGALSEAAHALYKELQIGMTTFIM